MKKLVFSLMAVLFFTNGLAMAQGGDEICPSLTSDYWQTLLSAQPQFALYSECGLINLDEDFVIQYPVEMVNWEAGLDFLIDPIPVNTSNWDNFTEFLDYSEDVAEGNDALVVRTNGSPIVIIGHTYFDQDDQPLGLEPIRRAFQNSSWEIGQEILIIQESGQFITTARLTLVDAKLVLADEFELAAGTIYDQIAFDLEALGYTETPTSQQIILAGCYGLPDNPYGWRVLFTFELTELVVQQKAP